MEVFKNSVKKSKQSDSEMPPEMPLMPGFVRNSILSASFRSVRSSSLSAITKYGSVIESSSFKSLNSRFLLEFYKIVYRLFSFRSKLCSGSVKSNDLTIFWVFSTHMLLSCKNGRNRTEKFVKRAMEVIHKNKSFCRNHFIRQYYTLGCVTFS